MKRLLILLLTLSLLLPLYPPIQTANAQDEPEVRTFIVGPDALGISDKAVYAVTVVGGPGEEEGGVWRVAAHLTGKNVTDADPTLADPYNITQESNVFRINVTTPGAAQSMDLNIIAWSILGNQSVHVEDRFGIAVVNPINIRTTVSNPSNMTLKNVLVNFRVDGELVGSSTIDEIGPLAEGTATFSWITKRVSPGRHELGIEIDLNGDGIIDETKGDILHVTGFYSPQEGANLLYVALVIILFIVILFLLPSTLRKKKKRK